jgi:hypothetical protein
MKFLNTKTFLFISIFSNTIFSSENINKMYKYYSKSKDSTITMVEKKLENN